MTRRRLRREGVPVAQITTGGTCHLDASMVARGLDALTLDGVRLLFIETSATSSVRRPSTSEKIAASRCYRALRARTKPLKYPPIFTSAHAVVLNKIDAAAALGFDRTAALANIRRVAPQAEVMEISAAPARASTAGSRICAR